MATVKMVTMNEDLYSFVIEDGDFPASHVIVYQSYYIHYLGIARGHHGRVPKKKKQAGFRHKGFEHSSGMSQM